MKKKICDRCKCEVPEERTYLNAMTCREPEGACIWNGRYWWVLCPDCTEQFIQWMSSGRKTEE